MMKLTLIRHANLTLAGLLGLMVMAVAAQTATAYAATAQASQNVNVRSGPGTQYGVLDQLTTGETVDVTQCHETFCYVTHNGRPGWVSASYLTRGPAPVSPDLALNANEAPLPPSGPLPPANDRLLVQRPPANIGMGAPGTFVRPDQACFFDDFGFRGDRFCLAPGQQRRVTETEFGPLTSIRNPAGLRITACDDFRNCQVYSASVRDLGGFGAAITTISID